LLSTSATSVPNFLNLLNCNHTLSSCGTFS
jgi:hypothetical protein